MNQESPPFVRFTLGKEMTQAKKTPSGVYTYPSPTSDPPPVAIHIYKSGGLVAFHDGEVFSVTYNTDDVVYFARDKVFPYSFRVVRVETHDGLVVE